MRTFFVLLFFAILLTIGVFAIRMEHTHAAAALKAHQEADDLTRAMRTTEFCVSVVTYAETVDAERRRGVPRDLALRHIADTSFAYKNSANPTTLATAAVVINTIYDRPGQYVDFWAACHQAAR